MDIFRKKKNRVETERTKTHEDVDTNIGSSGEDGEKEDNTGRVEDGNQADSEIDSKDTIEPKHKKKKKKSKKKKTQETSEKQSAHAQDEEEQGQATQQNIGSSGEDGEKKDETDSVEPTQEKKKKKSKRKKTQETQESSEEQAAQAQDEEEQGQATQKSEEKDSVFVARSAKKCIFIPETRIVMYSNEASCLVDDWSQLVSVENMDETNSKFEIEIINMGKNDKIAMGIFHYGDKSAPPGWCKKSVGYHLNNGSVYSGNLLEATQTTDTRAKRGDKITLEIRRSRNEGEEWDEQCFCHLKINNKDITSGLKIPGWSYTYVCPCIAMSSKGAAVKLLNDTFWMVKKTCDRIEARSSDSSSSDEYKAWAKEEEIPTMSTVEKDGIMISPKETITMSERRGCVCGLMSICNKSPNKQSIAFEVRYGKSDTSVIRDVLAHTHAWAERLCVQKDDMQETIIVEWTPIHNDDAKTHLTEKKWTLEEICQTMNIERQSYRLKVNTGTKEIKCDDKRKTMDAEQPMEDDDLLNIVRYTSPWGIERLIFRDTTYSENARLLTKAQESGHSAYRLLQLLAEENLKGFKRDEDTMLEKVKTILKDLKGDYEDILARYDDGTGFTVLHFAAALGSEQLIHLLEYDSAKIAYLSHVKNCDGNLPLHLAIKGKHDQTAKVLLNMMERTGFRIKHIIWNKENKDSKKGIGLTVKELLESKMIETTKWVLDKFEDDEKEEYYVAPLQLDNQKRCPDDEGYNHKDKTAYDMIVQDFFKELANHECVKALSEYKWRKYGQRMFWVSFILYLIFWGALTTAVVTGVAAKDATKYDQPVDYVRLLSEIAALCYAILTLCGEGLQCHMQGLMYLSDGYNYLDILSSILIISVLPLRLLDSGGQWGCFAVGYIIWTFRSIKFLTVIRARGLGQLGHIIIRLVLHDVWKFALYFLVILFGFSGGLFLTLKGDTNLNVHNETSTFWGILFVGVRVLIEGQPFLDYTGPEGYRPLSCVIMLIFLASTCVVMLNIFIAQLSSRYTVEMNKVEDSFEKRRVATMEDRSSGLLGICNSLWSKQFQEYVDTYEKQRRSDEKISQRLRKWCRILSNKLCRRNDRDVDDMDGSS